MENISVGKAYIIKFSFTLKKIYIFNSLSSSFKFGFEQPIIDNDIILILEISKHDFKILIGDKIGYIRKSIFDWENKIEFIEI